MKIILVGEPMALFMANEPGPLSEVKTFTASIAGKNHFSFFPLFEKKNSPLLHGRR